MFFLWFVLGMWMQDTISDVNQTLLHAAAGAGHLEICAMLLSRTEIDINAQSETGEHTRIILDSHLATVW